MKTKDIYSQPGHLIRRAYQIATASFMAEAKPFDLTPVQFSALVAIRENPGIDATRVSDLIYFDRATIGNVLERLENKGWISRKPGTHDRRTKHLFLTPNGELVMRKIEATVPRVGERILGALAPSDRKLLLKLLYRLVEADGPDEGAYKSRKRGTGANRDKRGD
jgi:MarR family transcriptional regulator, lower aerobic nicotinate degradation pathway regulator